MYKIWIGILVCLFFLTGCWDKVEINDTAFVIAIGVDAEEESYRISYVYPNLPVYTGQAEGEALFIRTVEDDTMEGAVKKLASQMSKSINFEHLETLVVGTSLLQDREKLYQMVDYLERNNEFPRRIPVLAAAQPERVLQPEHSESGAVGRYIRGIYDNNQSVIQNYEMVLQDFVMHLEKKESLILPILHAENGFYKIEDAVIYQEMPLGVLSTEEMEAMSWLKEMSDGMEYAMELDSGHVSMEIEKSSCKYSFRWIRGIVHLKAQVEATMQIKECTALDEQAISITELKETAQEQMKTEMETIVRRMQKQYKTDLVSFPESLKFQNRSLYMELQPQWKMLFSKMQFSVETEVTIENIGMKG